MLSPQCSNDRLVKRVKGFCDEKYEDAELCEYMQGFYNCRCNTMFDVSKAYFAITQFHLYGYNSPIARATSKA